MFFVVDWRATVCEPHFWVRGACRLFSFSCGGALVGVAGSVRFVVACLLGA